MVNVLPVPTAPTAPHCPHQLSGCLVTDHSLHKPSAPWAPSLQGPHPRARWAPSLHPECTGGRGRHHRDWVHSAHGLTVACGPWAPELWPHTAPHTPSLHPTHSTGSQAPLALCGVKRGRGPCAHHQACGAMGWGWPSGSPPGRQAGGSWGQSSEWAGAPPGPAQGGLRGRAPRSLEPPESPGKRPEGTVGWGAPTTQAGQGQGPLEEALRATPGTAFSRPRGTFCKVWKWLQAWAPVPRGHPSYLFP